MARRPAVIDNAQVAAVFRSYHSGVAAKLLALRRLILDVASSTEGVGPVEETLRWGQPSYLTAQSGSGSTIRIDQVRSEAHEKVPKGALGRCIALALIYHRSRGRRHRSRERRV